jgi:adenylosuccinate synthase
MNVEYVDICCGLAWGDEGKGKIVSQLSKDYDFVCRWAGGNNAGHTIYVDGKKYSTHLIPSGVFYGKKSIIGPGCVVNIEAFHKEIEYLSENGFDTSLIKISPKAHVVMDKHIEEDKKKYASTIGTTAKGIGPCYSDKYARIGKQVIDYIVEFKDYIWDEKLYGKVLCEGAQGFWLDIDYGNYPYVTSSNALPYSACSLGFPPQKIRKIYGAVKIYDTRVGFDPDFPESLYDDKELTKIATVGEEYGTTTGRMRKVNYLDVSKLLKAINISGVTHLIISKVDILQELNICKYYYKNTLISCDSIDELQDQITNILRKEGSNHLIEIIYSSNPERI